MRLMHYEQFARADRSLSRLTAALALLAGGTPLLATGPTPTGSPSAGTATVSATTIAGALERVDELGKPFDLSVGGSYAGGDFGVARKSTILSVPLSVRYKAADLRFSASIPYMRIRSDGVIFTGIDSTAIVAAPGINGRRRTARGMGDLTLGGTYTLPKTSANAIEVEVSGRVKLPTGKAALTSNRVDYAIGLQATKQVGRFAPFASATYRILGDPRVLRLRDGFAASAGASFYAGDRTVVLASYHYARAATRLVPDAHELFVGASAPMPDSRMRLTAYATAGLTQGAAAASGGLSASIGF